MVKKVDVGWTTMQELPMRPVSKCRISAFNFHAGSPNLTRTLMRHYSAYFLSLVSNPREREIECDNLRLVVSLNSTITGTRTPGTIDF